MPTEENPNLQVSDITGQIIDSTPTEIPTIDTDNLAKTGTVSTEKSDQFGQPIDTGKSPLIMQPTFIPELGAACHMRQNGQVPVAAITDIQGNIIFRNYESQLTKWVIRKLRTQVTRFWQASTAYIVLTTGNTDLEKGFSPLPTLGFNARYPGSIQTLELNDEICIWLGYLDSLRPVTDADLEENRLLRVFVGVAETISATGTAKTGASLTIQCRDRMKYLMDSLTSYNSIEDLELTSGVETAEEGVVKRSTVIISLARRAMGHITGSSGDGDICPGPVCGKTVDEGIIHDLQEVATGAAVAQAISPDVLYGNNIESTVKVKLTYDYSTFTKLQKQHRKYQNQRTANARNVTVSPDSNDALRRSVLGDAEVENQASGIENTLDILPGVEGTTYSREIEVTVNTSDPRTTPADIAAQATAKAREQDKFADDATAVSSPVTAEEGSQERSLRSLTTNVELPTEMPKFHIVVGRRAYEQSDWGTSFSMVERRPLEYIKTLAAQEIAPTEVFQDHRSGDYYFTPRANDPTGLGDPAKFYRTYFWRAYPSGARPDQCQMLTTWKDERSTIGFRSNIVVTTIQAMGNDEQGITVHLKVVPKWLVGKKFACTYYTVSDPSIRSTNEAAVLAHKFARVNSKEVRGGQAEMLGDPSLCPGEVIQVIGSPSHQLLTSDNNLDKTAYEEERSLFKDYNQAYNDQYAAFANAVKDADSGKESSSIDEIQVAGEPMSVNMQNISGAEHGAAMCNLGGNIPEQATASDSKNTAALTYPEEPRSIFRIQAVMHRFNDRTAGFFTEVYVISPF